MFFILRTAFWLSLVILLIPADASTGDKDQTHISTFQAIGAAQETYSDMVRFCERNRTACETGSAALDIFSAKARTGARMIYEYLGPDSGASEDTSTVAEAAPHITTGSIKPGEETVSAYPAAEIDTGTLTANDMAPAWTAASNTPTPRAAAGSVRNPIKTPPLPQEKPTV
ncbi:DUF5330 domain-containing protein [Breoghania sp.]|uniref:DUF5330 domain-containing protein n=1 Tax=Breoghania sp. TaxID=2065378 RepID=UPI002AA7506C|nr:DUF5330 domain-containing protein [Breoghania sp.]